MGCACSTDENGKGAHRILVGKPEERDHLEDLLVDERIRFL